MDKSQKHYAEGKKLIQKKKKKYMIPITGNLRKCKTNFY